MKRDSKSIDMIGRVFRNMFAVQILTMLTGIAGSVVDGMVTGKFLGEAAMAAFGFTNTVTLLVAIVGSVLSTGTAVLCGNSLGKGELDRTRDRFSVCFTATLLTAAVLAVVIFVSAVPAAKLLGAKNELIQLASDYIRGYAIACPGVLFVAFLMPVMQMDGQMNRLMAAVAVMTVGDIAADLFNVLVLHGGMFGMAAATAASYYLALCVLLPHFQKRNGIFTRPRLALDGGTVSEMIRNGIPTAVSQLGRLLLNFLFNLCLMRLYGGSAVAAHAVILSAGNLCLVPGSALGTSTQVITGVLCGEEDRSGIKSLLKTAARYNLIVNGLCMLVFFLLARSIVSLFYTGASPAELAVTGFRYYTLCMVFYGVNLIMRSYCQGSSQSAKAIVITLCDCFVAPLCMAVLLGALSGLPALWLCFAVGEGLVSLIVLALFRLRSGKQTGFEAFIPFTSSFGQDILASFECVIDKNDVGEAVRVSRETSSFCLQSGADRRTAFLLGLAVEEAVGNVIEHGFSDGKPHSIALCVRKKPDCWLVRIRDDCRLFDVKKYMEQYTSDDPAQNIGLKMIMGAAEDVTYYNALSLNNLTLKLPV